MEKSDVLLFTVGHATSKGHRLSPVQLQKSLFVIGKKFTADLGDDFYEFVPHFYGPFSGDVYVDVDQLIKEGFISKHMPPHNRWAEYEATNTGIEKTNLLSRTMPSQIVAYIEDLIPKIVKLSFGELVSLIYKHFPTYKTNSVFRGEN